MSYLTRYLMSRGAVAWRLSRVADAPLRRRARRFR